jgi:hypothetical protein
MRDGSLLANLCAGRQYGPYLSRELGPNVRVIFGDGGP